MENINKYKRYLKLKNLSDRTIQSYLTNIRLTSEKIGKNIDLIDENDLADYLFDGLGKDLSGSSQNLLINSFKSYFKIIHNKDFDKSILPRPNKEQKQPDILSIEEVRKMLDLTSNLKHNTIIKLMYSGALRVSELVSIRIKDVDPNNNKINIREPKGNIDRFIPLDNHLLKALRDYWNTYKTSEYLFEGATGNKYSVGSVQKLVRDSAKKAGINKRISSHSLRHSAITHLIKNGENIRAVQKLAGHKNINTTAGYIRIFDEDVTGMKPLLSEL